MDSTVPGATTRLNAPRTIAHVGSVAVSLAVLDIDGVVADVRHRLHHIERRPKDWGRFFTAATDDPALEPGVRLATDLAQRHEVVWLTGRPSWLRAVTSEWLERHDLPGRELHMRARSDYRPARLFKLGVLDTLRLREIAAFVDDDSEVIDAAVEAGYPAVFADWLPRARALRDAQDRLGRS
jgi:hypothetical protein